jgi:CDGSH-type Zn-finger protein
MARLIRHDARGPAIIDVNGKLIEVCQCGLSRNKPFCDGSHSRTHGEEPGKMYSYPAEGERVELVDMFPPPTKKYRPEDAD